MGKIGLTAHFSLLTGPETKIGGHTLFRATKAKKGPKQPLGMVTGGAKSSVSAYLSET